jgi:iron complex transport system substrate-binding protein
VRQAAAALPGAPRVLSVNPTTLDEVFDMFHLVGQSLSTPAERNAARLFADFTSVVESIAQRRRRKPRPRVMLLEWLDPPYTSGHWNPEVIEAAGGHEVLGQRGERARRCSGDEIQSAAPEILIIAPCGWKLDRTAQELDRLRTREEWQHLAALQLGRVALVDGNAYFSRPGPRLEASLRIAAAIIDPETCGELAPATHSSGWRWLDEEVIQE